MIDEEKENEIINDMLWNPGGIRTQASITNAAIILKEVTFHTLLGTIDSYPNDGLMSGPYYTGIQHHFDGIDRWVDEYYEALDCTDKVGEFREDKWINRQGTTKLWRAFKPLLLKYYQIFQANKDDFQMKMGEFIAIYAFTKIVHFNLEFSQRMSIYPSSLPADRYIIFSMDSKGTMQMGVKNLSRPSENKAIRFLLNSTNTLNIRNAFEMTKERTFPSDQNGKTVALVGARGYVDRVSRDPDCTLWQLSRVLGVLREPIGFNNFFLIKNRMRNIVKFDDPGELKGKNFEVMIDGKAHVFRFI